MRRIVITAALALGLACTALAGPASAAVTASQHNPVPHCVTVDLFALKCTCPPGWAVQWAPWWEVWNMDGRWCVRKAR